MILTLNSFTFARCLIVITGVSLITLNGAWLYLSYTGWLSKFLHDNSSYWEKEKTALLEHIKKCKKECSTFNSIKQGNSFSEKKDATAGSKERIWAKPIKRKVFLSMGIPSVLRKTGQKYLFDTLHSLIENSSEKERQNALLVIAVTNFEEQYNIDLVNYILEEFNTYYESGFLHIIQPPSIYYPTFENLRQTYNDSIQRVKWRSKQVLDYAYVMNYSSTFSNYYLLLEDDIIASPNYITAISEFLLIPQKFWVQLDFTSLTSIGKLYKSIEAKRLSKFLMLFYAEQPVDFLIQYFYSLFVPPKQNTKRSPSLFQHVGQISSLNNKIQDLQDPDFLIIPREFNIKNPPANIFTDITHERSYYIQMAYNSAPGCFWGINPRKGNHVLIIFHKPININKIFVRTGLPDIPNDILDSGRLEASGYLITKSSKCNDYIYVADFHNGSVDIPNFEELVDNPIYCLRITVTEDINHWVIIREIAIFRS